MSAIVRQIRKLDGLPETKVVHGVTFETGVPLPDRSDRFRAGELVEVLSAMEVGHSFLHHSHGRAAARTLKPKKFTSHLQPDGRWRIWRTQ